MNINNRKLIRDQYYSGALSRIFLIGENVHNSPSKFVTPIIRHTNNLDSFGITSNLVEVIIDPENIIRIYDDGRHVYVTVQLGFMTSESDYIIDLISYGYRRNLTITERLKEIIPIYPCLQERIVQDPDKIIRTKFSVTVPNMFDAHAFISGMVHSLGLFRKVEEETK